MVKEHPFASEASPRLLALATTAAALLLFFLSILLHAAAEEQHNWITVGNASSSCDTAIDAVNGNIVGEGGGGGEGGGCGSLTISHAQPELEGWFEMASDMVGLAVLRRRRLASDPPVTVNVALAGKAACRDKNMDATFPALPPPALCITRRDVACLHATLVVN